MSEIKTYRDILVALNQISRADMALTAHVMLIEKRLSKAERKIRKLENQPPKP